MADRIIDVHSHPLLPIFRKAVATATSQPIDNVRMYDVPMPSWSLDDHLRVLDEYGLSAAILSLPGVANLATGTAAAGLCREINEEFAGIVARHPARFGAFATLPLDDMTAALDEVAYALDILKLDGIGIGTGYGGRYLGDPYFDPLLAELHRRGAVLFVHPGPPPGYKHDGGIDVSVLEFVFDTTRMLTNMVLFGAKKRYADIRIISTHGGGTIPYLVHRLAMLEPLFGAGYGRPTLSAQDLTEGLASFYYDLTASTGHASLDAILRLVPAEQLFFGTDFAMMPAAQIGLGRQKLETYAGLNAPAREKIYASNILNLLPLMSSRMTR